METNNNEALNEQEITDEYAIVNTNLFEKKMRPYLLRLSLLQLAVRFQKINNLPTPQHIQEHIDHYISEINKILIDGNKG